MSPQDQEQSLEGVRKWMEKNKVVEIVDQLLASVSKDAPEGRDINSAFGRWGRVTGEVLSEDPSWKALQAHFLEHQTKFNMNDLFKEDENRFETFSRRLELDDNFLFLDYSKNLIDAETMRLLTNLAESCNVEKMRDEMFRGDKINFTENRSVLHTALRNRSNKPVLVDGKDVMPGINDVLGHMKEFSTKVRDGTHTGHSGKRINHIVNIGIGGSDLGPIMVTKALKPYCHEELRMHFVANIDGSHITHTLKNIDLEATLFIVASKTFTTAETITNATAAKKAVIEHYTAKGDAEGCIAKHFIALSTNETEVAKFGIDVANMFSFWDWVGGRYSLWSAIGMSICIAIGYDNYVELLEGGYAMDQHFQEAPLSDNIPVILALIGVLYNNLHAAQTQMILPYDQSMIRFASYFQQGDMESNGKFMTRSGNKVKYQTGPIILGEPGTTSQHSFFQLIHQGTKLIPCDFLGCMQTHNNVADGLHHRMLMANYFAQTEALMKGKTEAEARAELANSELTSEAIDKIVPHKVFEGNHPTNSILVKKLTPKSLGALISMYEHKVFVQGVIWDINSFDQWGVELGKALAVNIQKELERGEEVTTHDQSTNGLINLFNKTFE